MAVAARCYRPRTVDLPQPLRVLVLQHEPASDPLVAATSSMRVVAVVPLCTDALARLAALDAQVIVLDLRSAPPGDVEHAARRVRAAAPDAALVVVGPPNADAVARAALLAGAHAYEGSHVTAQRIARAVFAAAKGTLHLNSTGRRAALGLAAAPRVRR